VSNEHGFNPVAAFHDGRDNSQAPPTFGLLRQVDKRAGGASELLQLRVGGQEFFGKTGARLPVTQAPLRRPLS
jgi:hypothetical protein